MKNSYDRPHTKLERRRGVFFRIGMMISLLITFVAFEWKTAVPREEIDNPTQWDEIEEEIIPITWRREEVNLPLPKEINKALAPVELTKEFVIIPDNTIQSETPIDSFLITDILPISLPTEKIPDGEDFTLIPEIFPEFPGKEEGLMKFLQINTKYPKTAHKSGISGTVHLSFIIDENGDVVSIECLRSPSPILTEEAIRVLNKMPKWKPGYQGGKKVGVKMTLPFTFTLKM